MSRTAGKGDVVALIFGVALMLIMPMLISTYTLTVLVIYGMLGLSLGVIWGFGGILCFGQAAFFGLGAYTYAVAAINIGESTLPMLLTILVPAIFAALLGLEGACNQPNPIQLPLSQSTAKHKISGETS